MLNNWQDEKLRTGSSFSHGVRELTLLAGMCHRWGLFVVGKAGPAVSMCSEEDASHGA